MKYSKFSVIDTVIVFFANDCSPELDLGNRSFTTCGLATAEAKRKNNIRKNIISFNAAVCTSAFGFSLLRLIFIYSYYNNVTKSYIKYIYRLRYRLTEEVDKLNSIGFHTKNDAFYPFIEDMITYTSEHSN